MKTKSLIQVLFILLLLFMLSYSVFAIQGSDSSGSVTSYSGTTGAAAASGSSSDSAVSGGRVSAGGSAVSSGYSDGTTSGTPGADLSTSDAGTQAEPSPGTGAQTGTDAGAEAQTETDGGLNNIPSGGGAGAGATEGASSEAAEATTTEQTTIEAEAQAAENAAETAAEGAAPAENAVTVAIEMSEGASVTLAPQTGAAGMSVLAVTATTATIVITRDGANSITGGAIYSTDQETTMEVGETIDVDSDGDGVADLQITLSRIDYNAETGKYEGVFTLTYLNPSQEVVSFVKEQVERGEVAFVSGSGIEEISFAYWVWVIVALIVVGVLALVGWVLFDKKNKKRLPTAMPTHYFEKLVRQEVSTPKEDLQEVKMQEIKKEEGKKELAQEVKNEAEKGSAQIIVSEGASSQKKKKKVNKKSKRKINKRKKKKSVKRKKKR